MLELEEGNFSDSAPKSYLSVPPTVFAAWQLRLEINHLSTCMARQQCKAGTYSSVRPVRRLPLSVGAKLSSRIAARAVKALLGPPNGNGRGSSRSPQNTYGRQNGTGPATRVVKGSLQPASPPPSQPLVGRILSVYLPCPAEAFASSCALDGLSSALNDLKMDGHATLLIQSHNNFRGIRGVL